MTQIKISFLLLFITFCAQSSNSQSYRLPTDVIPVTYDLWIKINLDTFRFDGNVTIRIKVLSETNTISLNAAEIDVPWENAELSTTPTVSPNGYTEKITEEIVELQFANTIPVGEYDLNLSFEADIRSDLKGLYRSSYGYGTNKKYLAVTHLEPTATRRIFPCFDEPQFKARFNVHIYHDGIYTAISNGESLGTEGPFAEKDNYMLTTFKTSLLMPPYLLAFVVSDFKPVTSDDGKYTIYTPPDETDSADFGLEYAAKAVDWFTSYLNHPYAHTKCDFIAIPDFEMGAMENWGLITFRAIYLLYPNNEIPARYHQTGLQLITHELAHMWFGNEISPQWWDSLWLSEGFARFFEYYATEIIEPNWTTWDVFQVNNLQSALGQDDTENVRTVGGTIVEPSDIKFDYIVYAKAASIIRMFFTYYGDDVMQNALREYVKFETFNSVTPPVLYKYLQAQADLLGTDMPFTVEEFFNSWINNPGYPIVQADVNYESQSIAISTKRFYVDPSLLEQSTHLDYIIPLTIDNESSYPRSITWFTGASTSISYTPNTENEKLIHINSNQIGYYRVNYNDEHWDTLIEILHTDHRNISEQNRAKLIDDSINVAKAGLISFSKVFNLLSYMRSETSFVPWATANSALPYIIRVFRGSSEFDRVEKLIHDIAQTNYQEYKLKVSDLSNHNDRIHSLNSVPWACNYGVEDCIIEASELFSKEYLSETEVEFILEELEPTVYCSVNKYSDKYAEVIDIGSIITHLRLLMVEREANLDKIYRLITGFGCSRNEISIQNVLDVTILGDELQLVNIVLEPADRKHIILSIITGSYVGSKLALQFITENFLALDSVLEQSLGLWTEIFSALGQRIFTEELIVLYDEFIAKYDEFSTFRASLREVIVAHGEVATKNVEWFDKYAPDAEKWLEDNVKLPRDTGGASIMELSSTIGAIIIAVVARNLFM